MDGMVGLDGLDGTVMIGHKYSKSTSGAHKHLRKDCQIIQSIYKNKKKKSEHLSKSMLSRAREARRRDLPLGTFLSPPSCDHHPPLACAPPDQHLLLLLLPATNTIFLWHHLPLLLMISPQHLSYALSEIQYDSWQAIIKAKWSILYHLCPLCCWWRPFLHLQ